MKRREKITTAELETAAACLDVDCTACQLVREALIAEIRRRAQRRPVRWDKRVAA